MIVKHVRQFQVTQNSVDKRPIGKLPIESYPKLQLIVTADNHDTLNLNSRKFKTNENSKFAITTSHNQKTLS